MNRLNDTINKLTVGKYIQKTEVKEIQDELTSEKYDNLNTLLQIILNSKKYTAKLNKEINLLLECENTIDIIKEILQDIQDDNLEEILDSECTRYTKFTESNPTEHIKYDKTDKLYIYNGTKRIKKKYLKNLVIIAKENLRDKKGKTFSKIIPWKKIEYKK
jgi:hypothetical protein